MNNPKILLFDIETAPILASVWGVWQQNVHMEQIEQDWFCISWSAKWLYDNEVKGEVLTSKEIKKENDKRIIQKLWKLFDEADIIIAHNGDGFDIPRVNTRFVLHDLPCPSPYRSIDTLRTARKYFAFTHNKLDYLARVFGIECKLETNFKLWKDCLQGSDKALNKMLKYNKRDVTILEEVYLKLRPWMKSHPNLNVYADTKHCPYCGHPDLTEKGKYTTLCNAYTSYYCESCGGISRATKYTLAPIAR